MAESILLPRGGQKSSNAAAFSAYIASSPALWWNDNNEAKNAEKNLASNPGRGGFLFLSHGREVELMTRSIARLVMVLQNQHSTNLEWKFKVFTEENHESSPHRAICDGLEFIYKYWRFDFTYLCKEFNPEKKVFTASVLIDHYKS